MTPKRAVLIWSTWARYGHFNWQGRTLVIPIMRRFSTMELSPHYEELRFNKRNAGGYMVIECEGLIVHDARVVTERT